MALGLSDGVGPHGSRGGRDVDWISPEKMVVEEWNGLFLDFDFIHEIGGLTEAVGWNIAVLFIMQDHAFPHHL